MNRRAFILVGAALGISLTGYRVGKSVLFRRARDQAGSLAAGLAADLERREIPLNSTLIPCAKALCAILQKRGISLTLVFVPTEGALSPSARGRTERLPDKAALAPRAAKEAADANLRAICLTPHLLAAQIQFPREPLFRDAHHLNWRGEQLLIQRVGETLSQSWQNVLICGDSQAGFIFESLSAQGSPAAGLMARNGSAHLAARSLSLVEKTVFSKITTVVWVIPDWYLPSDSGYAFRFPSDQPPNQNAKLAAAGATVATIASPPGIDAGKLRRSPYPSALAAIHFTSKAHGDFIGMVSVKENGKLKDPEHNWGMGLTLALEVLEWDAALNSDPSLKKVELIDENTAFDLPAFLVTGWSHLRQD